MVRFGRWMLFALGTTRKRSAPRNAGPQQYFQALAHAKSAIRATQATSAGGSRNGVKCAFPSRRCPKQATDNKRGGAQTLRILGRLLQVLHLDGFSMLSGPS